MLKRGKDTIERLIGDNYQCEVLRAGGYNIQPSETLIKAMRQVGLRADSSIYPGGKETGSLSRYDYSMVKDNRSGYESNDPKKILDGDLDDLIYAYLRSQVKEKSNE